MINLNVYPSQFDRIVELLAGSRAFLVGGAIRDQFLERPIHDLDFALPKGTIPAAKRVADKLGGSFFILDKDRQTCRVILTDDQNQRLVVDFTLFQGASIEEDLASRDFTITSMAFDLQDLEEVIDPLGGAQDLLDGLIRPSSETALENDPLRCIRAVRLAAQLGFQILPETKEQIRQFHSGLQDISRERIRDEFFRLLEGPNLAGGILSLQVLGLYSYILPGELSSRSSSVVRGLEGLWSLFLQNHDQDRAGSWSRGLLVHRLGRYRDRIREFLNLELVPGRSIYQLMFLFPLLSGLAEDETPLTSRQIIDLIPLSNQEAEFLANGLQAQRTWQDLSQDPGEDQPVSVFHFFNQFGQAGAAGIFLDLGENLELQPVESSREDWIRKLGKARYYLEGFWERNQEWVDPPSLLNGDDIQGHFHLPPGPEIGSLLYSLREEQVRGGIKTRQEGLAYLKHILNQPPRKKL